MDGFHCDPISNLSKRNGGSVRRRRVAEVPSPADVAAALAAHVGALAEQLIGAPPSARHGHQLRFRRKGSLAVDIAGPHRGAWQDFEAGEGGDALALIAHLRRCTMAEAWRWALEWLGLPPPMHRAAEHTPPQPQNHPVAAAEKAEGAIRLWREARPALGSPVEAYLHSRRLVLPEDAPLRFHPACPRGLERLPAMLALMTTPEGGQPAGVHRTFLAADGSGKAAGQAKMMLGAAGLIRLVPDEEVHAGLGVAEGIETALAVMQGWRWRPVWATGSAGGIAGLPVLAGIEALTLFADGDAASLCAAEKCHRRWLAAGREVRCEVPPDGRDFADLLAETA